MIYMKILSIIALVVSIIWFIKEPDYRSGLVAIGSISALISAFLIERKKERNAHQHQSVSGSSIGVQAGGDVNIGTNRVDKHAK